VSSTLEQFVGAGPPLQRPALRLLLALARRPRGRRLLARIPPADEAAEGILWMCHYDEPAPARRLGWDAEAVIRRGRELRTARR
jgi:hypothetical protein